MSLVPYNRFNLYHSHPWVFSSLLIFLLISFIFYTVVLLVLIFNYHKTFSFTLLIGLDLKSLVLSFFFFKGSYKRFFMQVLFHW